MMALLTSVAPTTTQAQVARGSVSDADDAEESTSFLGGFGLAAERVALEQGGETRRRALRRMFTFAKHAPQAVAELLDEWLTARPKLDPLDTWLVTRAFTQLHQVPAARRYLVDALAGERLSVEAEADFATAVPRTAALALAKSDDPEALKWLGEWLRRPSERARWAQAALLAHKPSRVSPLLSSIGPATVVLVETLGALGDPSAVPFLRRVVKRATADVQSAAAVALARLGVRETQDLASLWLGQRDAPIDLLRASAWIYLHFEHPRRGAAFATLLERSPADALSVAEHSRPNDVATPIADRFAVFETSELQRRALAVLVRAGSDAVPSLLRLFHTHPERRWDVAASLSEIEAPVAAQALWTLIGNEQFRAPALASLVAHQVLHPEASLRGELVDELQRWSAGPPTATREVARSGLAALDETIARRFLAGRDVSLISAAALASSVHDDVYRTACLERLHQISQPVDSTLVQVDQQTLAASAVLSHVDARASLSLQLLSVLAVSEPRLEHVAKWHFNARRDPAPSTTRFSNSRSGSETETSIRLASWPVRDVSQALEHLQVEPDAALRAAWLTGLYSQRSSRVVRHVLTWHADFEPEGWVRRLASAPRGFVRQRRALWIGPRAPDAPPSVGYWIQATHPLRLPVALFVPHGHPTVVFIEGIPNLPSSETSYLTEIERVGMSPAFEFPRIDVLDAPLGSATP